MQILTYISRNAEFLSISEFSYDFKLKFMGDHQHISDFQKSVDEMNQRLCTHSTATNMKFPTQQHDGLILQKADNNAYDHRQISHKRPTNAGISNAFTRSKKKADTSGTIKKARVDGPYCCVTAVMLAIAVGVDPREIPPKPAQITAAS